MVGTADLHSHTTASDGSLAPAALVALAAGRGVGTLAVTDHDTLAGLPAAAEAAGGLGVRLVFGVELSVRIPHGSMHLVGYFDRMAPPAILGWLEELRAGRVTRAEQIVGRLGDLGVGVEMDAVLARADGPVGRPHIADAMVAAGHVGDRQAAFDRYLGDGRPAWVPTQGLGPTESIALVAEAGGVSSLAHPASLRLDGPRLGSAVQRLAARGLGGIEVYRPEHHAERRRAYRRLAERFGLVATGGSDFHHLDGPARPGDTGDPPLPADAIDRLLATRG